MNKLKYALLVLSIFACSTLYVHAEEATTVDPILTTTINEETTTANTGDRAAFIATFLEKKAVLAQLRLDINAARTKNNDLVQQIKALIHDADRTAIQAKLTKIQELRTKSSTVITEAKTYVAEKGRVKDEIVNSVKNGKNVDVAALNQQKEEITTKLSAYKTELTGYRSELNTLLAEVKTFRDQNKASYQEIKELYAQTNQLHLRITTEINSQKGSWEDFKSAVTSKEYGAAIEAFNAIITSKQIVLSDLNLKNTLLQSILDKYKA